MTKAELITRLSETMTTEDAKVTKKAAGEALDAVFTTVKEALVAGEEVAIPGFGKFSVGTREGVIMLGDRKGETYSSRNVKFKTSSTLKAELNA